MKSFIIICLFLFSPLRLQAELKVIGTALLEYSIFKIDVYQITFKKNDKGLEQLVLDYKIDVAKKHSIEGWNVGLKKVIEDNKIYQESLQWIINNTVDFNSGDQFIIQRKNDLTQFIKNGKTIATTSNPLVSKVIFEPWLGTYPIDKEIKQKLGGKR